MFAFLKPDARFCKTNGNRKQICGVWVQEGIGKCITHDERFIYGYMCVYKQSIYNMITMLGSAKMITVKNGLGDT